MKGAAPPPLLPTSAPDFELLIGVYASGEYWVACIGAVEGCFRPCFGVRIPVFVIWTVAVYSQDVRLLVF